MTNVIDVKEAFNAIRVHFRVSPGLRETDLKNRMVMLARNETTSPTSRIALYCFIKRETNRHGYGRKKAG